MARECRATDQWTASSVSYVAEALEQLRQRVQADGQLTHESLLETLAAFDNKETELTTRLKQLHSAQMSQPNGENGSAEKSRHCLEALAYLDEKIAVFRGMYQEMSEEESNNDLVRLSAAVLPSAETLDKILRYETALERQFYRALNQLERLQRMRHGETMPPPFVL